MPPRSPTPEIPPATPASPTADEAAELAGALRAAGQLLGAHLAARRRAVALLADWAGHARDGFDAESAALIARLDPATLDAAATRVGAAAARAAPLDGGAPPRPAPR